MRVDHLLGLEVASATGRVEELRHGSLSWLMIERPGTAELQTLDQRFGFHPLDLEDLVSKTERPKIDTRPDYVFVVLHFPVLAGRPRRLTAGELHIFLGSDYLVTARAKGLRDRVVVLRHALRNALIPVVTVVGLQLGALLSGAVLTETVFGRVGVGRYILNAITARDYPVVQATVIVVALFVVVISLVVDLVYAILDPRIRYA